ncbi:MAG: hypothetical protein AB7P03_23535 [Kofleriaceae bacterium]
MRTPRFGLLGICVAAMIGCGGSGGGMSPRELCEDLMTTACSRSYDCYSSEELSTMMFPATEQECAMATIEERMCSAQTRETLCGDKKFRADKAAACLDELASLSCPQVRDPDLNAAQATPSCTQICGE